MSARALRAVVLLLSCFVAVTSQAQYFGQNKVRYKTFDFKVLHTPHFEIYYYDEAQPAIGGASRMAERWRARLNKVLEHQLSTPQPVILYANHPDFRSTTVIPGFIGETTGGVTEGLRRRVVLPLAGPLAETDHVLGHELVHAYQYDIAAQIARAQTAAGRSSGLEQLPLWFVEGMAEYLSLGPMDAHTAMWMRDAVRNDRLPRVKDLNDPDYFPYRFGHAFWAYVAGRWGDEAVGRMYRAGVRGGVEGAIKGVLGISEEELSRAWHAALREQYQPVLQRIASVQQVAQPVLNRERTGGEINVSPVVSPDGKWIAFFSERDLFSIDLYIADAATGKVRAKVTDLAVDPHVDSLQFVNSAGSWSPDSARFAYGVIRNGRPELALYDVAQEKVSQRIPLHDLGEIYSTSWSPDATQVALSAIQGGLTDLYIVQLENGETRRLTNDAFADLHPAWSPDGKRIAFTTDRFGADPGELSFGEYRIGSIDVASGNIEPLRAFEAGKHINPQWGDAQTVYFIAAPDGIANVYRARVDGGEVERVTNQASGVTGITALSPAMSVATQTGAVVFSVFDKDRYHVLLTPQPRALEAPRLMAQEAALLPQRDAAQGEVATLLEQPAQGLPAQLETRVTPYDPKLGLDYVAPPAVSVGVSNFGSLVGGGTALYFSDLLGYHQLMVGLQSASFGGEASHILRNFSGVVGYQNQRSRWTWGFIGGQVPFMSGGFGQGTAVVDGQPALIQQEVLFWQINREINAIAAYPFSRAQRVEFSAGYRNIDFVAEENTRVFSLVDGSLLDEIESDIPTPDALHLGVASGALVYDTSLFAGTSPVRGQRYRLEAGFSGGSLNFGTLLGDYRRYVQLARPLSLAGRLLHYGRYGGGAEDPRLQDLYIGYPTLVRGYEASSFSAEECGFDAAAAAPTCPVFDQLIGSRIGVANAEARLALLGPLGIIPSRRVPPVEAAIFYDAGIAWRPGADIARTPAASYGAAARFNIFGFAVGQVSYAIPMDRPLRDHVWQFTLSPGW